MRSILITTQYSQAYRSSSWSLGEKASHGLRPLYFMRLKCISEQGSASSSAGGFPLSPNNFHSKWQCAKFESDMTTSDHLVGFASLVEVCLHLGDFFVTRLEVY